MTSRLQLILFVLSLLLQLRSSQVAEELTLEQVKAAAAAKSS